jgi:hypothetical protein
LRKIEEFFNDIKFDKFGQVTSISLDNKLQKMGVLYRLAVLAKLPFYGLKKLKRLRIGWFAYSYKMKKAAERIMRATPALRTQTRNSNKLHVSLSTAGLNRAKLNKFIAPTERSRDKGRKIKLFNFLALTYLNIFKFKVSHPIFNKLKLRQFKKELIKENYNKLKTTTRAAQNRDKLLMLATHRSKSKLNSAAAPHRQIN